MKQRGERLLFTAILGLLSAAASYAAPPNVPVTVTNPPTNPVRTDEAFVRSPVHVHFCGGSTDPNDPNPCLPLFSGYVVPADQVLVVETISAEIECFNGAAEDGPLVGFAHIEPGSFDPNHIARLPMQLTSRLGSPGGGFQLYHALLSVRMVFPGGTRIEVRILPCALDDKRELTSSRMSFYGYLVSGRGFSLAP